MSRRSVVTTAEATIFAFGVRAFHQLMDLPLVAERVLSGVHAVPESARPAPRVPAQTRPATPFRTAVGTSVR